MQPEAHQTNHISTLTCSAKEDISNAFLHSVVQHNVSAGQIIELSKTDINGREIRNAMKLTFALSKCEQSILAQVVPIAQVLGDLSGTVANAASLKLSVVSGTTQYTGAGVPSNVDLRYTQHITASIRCRCPNSGKTKTRSKQTLSADAVSG